MVTEKWFPPVWVRLTWTVGWFDHGRPGQIKSMNDARGMTRLPASFATHWKDSP
jgi:hypothetical protein